MTLLLSISSYIRWPCAIPSYSFRTGSLTIYNRIQIALFNGLSMDKHWQKLMCHVTAHVHTYLLKIYLTIWVSVAITYTLTMMHSIIQINIYNYISWHQCHSLTVLLTERRQSSTRWISSTILSNWVSHGLKPYCLSLSIWYASH